MTARKNFEYYVHSGNKDDYGDPIVGISRVETHISSLLIPYPLVSLELTDRPKPTVIDGLVVPTQDEVQRLTSSIPRFNKTNTTLSFIDVFGEGEQIDLIDVTDTVASFVLQALEKARNHNIHVYNDLSSEEYDAINSAEDRIRKANTQGANSSEANIGTGMYL